jgi:hypothetical protein
VLADLLRLFGASMGLPMSAPSLWVVGSWGSAPSV